jgi:hypothetical protein
MADEVTMIGCKPISESANYELYIKDTQDDWEVWRRDDNIGTYSEILSSAVPLWGNNTFYISGATVDGMYKLRIVYR